MLYGHVSSVMYMYVSCYLAWTNTCRCPVSTLDHFTKYEHLQCIGMLVHVHVNVHTVGTCTCMAYGCMVRDGFSLPSNLGGTYNLARDRYLSWRKYLKLWSPDHDPWYMTYCLIDEKMHRSCGPLD